MSQELDSNRFEAHLDYLKLPYIRDHYRDAIQQATEHETDLLGCLMQLIDAEAQLRHDRSVERRLRLARFPVRKSLEQFDWTWPRKINRLQVQNLFRLQFIEQCSNVIIVGGVGLGKTHLATALGIAACQQSYSVLFTSAIDAVNTLTASQAAGRLKKDLGKFLRPRVLLLTNSVICRSIRQALTCCSRSSVNATKVVRPSLPPTVCSKNGQKSLTTTAH